MRKVLLSFLVLSLAAGGAVLARAQSVSVNSGAGSTVVNARVLHNRFMQLESAFSAVERLYAFMDACNANGQIFNSTLAGTNSVDLTQPPPTDVTLFCDDPTNGQNMQMAFNCAEGEILKVVDNAGTLEFQCATDAMECQKCYRVVVTPRVQRVTGGPKSGYSTTTTSWPSVVDPAGWQCFDITSVTDGPLTTPPYTVPGRNSIYPLMAGSVGVLPKTIFTNYYGLPNCNWNVSGAAPASSYGSCIAGYSSVSCGCIGDVETQTRIQCN